MSDGVQIVCPHCNQVNRIPSGKLASEARCGRYGQRLFTGDTFEADDAGLLKQMERSGIPVIVDFWAECCGPCRIMAPVFEQVAAALEPAARFLKVNVDKNQRVVGTLGVKGIPALLVLSGGEVVAQAAGVMNARVLEDWIKRIAGI